MENKGVIKQLEFYSNTIFSFIVLQGLGFCYNFAQNKWGQNTFLVE